MKAFVLMLVALLPLGLTGCVAPTYNYNPASVAVNEPPLNETHTAYVGDSLLRQGQYSEADAIYVKESVKIGSGYTVSEGFYKKVGDNGTSEFYKPGDGERSGSIDKIALVDPWQCLAVDKQKNNLCVITVFNVLVCEENAQFEKTKQPTVSNNSFQQTLIYSGKIGNKVRFAYREFSNSMARPAFNNDVEYDFDQSHVIGYKGARLEIIEATNELIKYRVLRNFNAP